jgi:hypothetical protein
MNYCRFENANRDLAGCIEALETARWDLDDMRKGASDHESLESPRFVRLCAIVAREFDGEQP